MPITPVRLAEIWREACQDHDLEVFAARLVELAGEDRPGLRFWVVGAPPSPDVRRWLAGGELRSLGADPARDGGLDAGLRPRDLTGPAVAAPLRGPGGATGALVVSGPGAASAADAATSGLADLLAELREPVAAALDADHRRRELAELRSAADADRRSLLDRLGRDHLLEAVVGSEGGLREVMARVAMVAGSDAPVLIFGETGSGKEVIARALHERSPRAAGPFTRVNCGAIPPELVDSQLFGHEKGAFTGAAQRHRGWFERSDGGTLLLDEIGELPPAAQVRLLRVLQDGIVLRVGGEVPMQVDVRIVAATHRDLAAMVQRGEFRADLWYRLAVFPVVLPPLRERLEDVPDLVDMLAHRAARRFGLRPCAATPADLALLASYAWPGNIRELGSVIDRAAILGDGRRLEIAKALGAAAGAPPAAPASGEAPARPAPAAGDAFAGDRGEVIPLDQAMARHIRAALVATRGRIEGPAGAAALLRINPHTLRARMRKLGVDWTRFR
ncbi:MAG TPA: sigma-54 dependent transcriptional regulator [Candidatus Krumholzibacteria bacterium]|nr:sigma-54 dependent transcriptional regulator [Candidatus Krumholzibacteria bacterium]HPD72924.1 sigma-54 dependent transcriptional regulator [Candidatus Krumholzibacteria bacterium]HRY41723.1 sigma-54 dependent transcriptional regulator [Candidatus Krumholzibacteria bacterium]